MQHNLPSQRQLPVYIERVPDSRDAYCKITLCLSWEVAESLSVIAAPFLAAVGQTVDTRTLRQIEQAALDRRRHEESEKNRRGARVQFMRAFRRVRGGVNYWEWIGALESESGLTVDMLARQVAWEIQKRDVWRAYNRVRNGYMRREHGRGVPVERLAQKFRLEPRTVRIAIKDCCKNVTVK